MAVAPKVRDLQALIKQQTKALQPQYALIDSDIKSNATAGAAQEAGLAATAEREYGNIEQRAENKGMFFSGFSPDEQATYNSTTYLPALAQLQATIAATRSQLMGKKAELGKGAFDVAFQAREGDIGRKFDWSKMTAQQKWDAKQAQIQRQFEAGESAKDRAAAAANASRSGSSDAASVLDADRKAISQELFTVTGNDGYVSPESYAKAKNAWVGSGYSGKTFDKYYSAYRNPENKYYKLSK